MANQEHVREPPVARNVMQGRLWMPGAQPRPTARCRTVASIQCAEQTSFDWRCGSLVAPQGPPQQRDDCNLTPKQKLRGYSPNSQKMMRTSFMDRRANLIKTKSVRASSRGKMDTNTLAISLLCLQSVCGLVVGVVAADLGQTEPQI